MPRNSEPTTTLLRINDQYSVAAERHELGDGDPPTDTGSKPRPKAKAKTESSK